MMKLLIVEDNIEMRKMMKKIFVNEFTQIFECGDGAEAFDTYEKYRPDWILMDIQMKKMDGITASRNILSKHKEAKIIIVTNYDYPKLKSAAKTAGVYGYLLKENLMNVFDLIKEG